MQENKKKPKIEKRVHFSIWYLIFGFFLMYFLEMYLLKQQIDIVPLVSSRKWFARGG